MEVINWKIDNFIVNRDHSYKKWGNKGGHLHHNWIIGHDCIVCLLFLRDYHNYFLARLTVNQWKIHKPVHFVFTHFQPITQCYKWRNSKKAPLQSIQPLWNTRYARSSKHVPQLLNKKRMCHSILVYHYPSFPTTTYKQHSMQKKCEKWLLLALHLLKSLTEAIIRVPQIITYTVVEKGREHKGEQK